MFYRKSLLVLSFIFGLASWSVQDASGQWGTGGGISSPRKFGLAGLQLFCDLSDPRSSATIDTTPSNASPNVRPSFKFSGLVVCAEVDASAPNPTLSNAKNFKASAGGGKVIGLFQLNQITDTALFPGLNYSESTSGGATRRTWTFDVTGHDSFPFAELLYELVPANLPNTHPLFGKAQKFCDPTNIDGFTDTVQPLLNSNNCKALFGLQMPVRVSDYPVNGLLNSGQVFTFSTLTKNGVEKALPLSWALCHTQRFVGPLTTLVDARANNSAMPSDGGSVQQANGLSVPIPAANFGQPLFVTAEPNDLWNAGPTPRWSNADGLIADLFTTAFKPNYLDQLDPEVAAFFPGEIPDQIGTNFGAGPFGDSFQAPYGTLVGEIDGTYKKLGTNPGPVTVNSNMLLFYWDLLSPSTPEFPQPDNTGSVEVTVAEDSIQCKADITPIASMANVHGEEVVQVAYQPTLNVKDTGSSTANFPATIIGCSNYAPSFTIQADGSPIINGSTQARVNGTPVTFTGFHVNNTISQPSCDGGQPLADLKLDLSKNSFIAAVAPGGKCTNGLNPFKLEIGSDANGWFGGTNTITLSQCK